MKQCSHCKQIKLYEAFSKNKGRADGHHHQCKNCRREYYEVNKVNIIQKSQQYYTDQRDAVLDRVKQRYINKRDELLEYHTTYRELNRDKVNAACRNWGKQNKSRKVAYNNKRKAAQLLRNPKWVDLEEVWLIEEVYDLAAKRSIMSGIQWHVDHVIPLQGKTVSGLHVMANLQVIPAKLNMSKGNRYHG